MKTSEMGRHEVKHFEGWRLVPYVCPAGKWTIGAGHRLYPKSKIPGLNYSGNAWTGKITNDTAEKLLTEDLERCEKAIGDLVMVALNQSQFDALVSFVFNVGRTAFANSTLCRKINKGMFAAAAEEFERWCHDDHGKVLPGLLRRRQHEKALFKKAI